MSRLSLLRKMADDDDKPTQPTAVFNVKPSQEDVPEKPVKEESKPETNQKWVDHLDQIDSSLLGRAKVLAHNIQLFEKLPPGPERMSKMRQVQEWKSEYKQLAVKLKEIVLNPDSGTFVTPQGPNQEKFENKILEQAGLTYNTYINRGELSKVYKSVFNEKAVIAKLTRSEDDKNTAMMLAALKESTPEEYSKHLLNIIDVKEVDFEDKKYYVIITELLNPANSHIRDLLSNLDLDTIPEYEAEGIATKKRSVKNLLRSTDEAWEAMIVNLLTNKFGEESALEAKPIAKFVKKYLFLMDNGGDYISLIDNARKTFSTKLEDLDSFGTRTVTEMTNSLVHFLSSVFKEVQIPSSTSDRTLESKNPQWAALSAMPETASFIQALMYFKDKGFKSIDLNRKNIMERPSTHDLVLADIGTLVPDKK